MSGALITDISDHLPIFYISQNTIKQEYFINSFRLQAPINIAFLQPILANTNWNQLVTASNCDDAYNIFIDKFSKKNL